MLLWDASSSEKCQDQDVILFCDVYSSQTSYDINLRYSGQTKTGYYLFRWIISAAHPAIYYGTGNTAVADPAGGAGTHTLTAVAGHYYAMRATANGSTLTFRTYDNGTTPWPQTGLVTLPAATDTFTVTNTAIPGAPTNEFAIGWATVADGPIRRVVAYNLDISATVTPSPLSGLTGASGTVALTGSLTTFSTGTSPTVSKSPTNDCTVTSNTASSATAASVAFSSYGATAGTITFTDPTSGATGNFPVSGPALTLTGPVIYQVFQRSGTTGPIKISGQHNDTTTTHDIEASWNGGAYATIATATVANVTFTGTLAGQPQGQGTLTVRFKDTPSALATVNSVGVGDVFVIAGQSNGSGRLASFQTYNPMLLAANGNLGYQATLFGNDYTWKILADFTDSSAGQIDAVSNDSDTTNGSIWPIVGTFLTLYAGVPIAFVPCALGGTSITQWQPGANHFDRTTLYGSMAYRATTGVGGVKAVLWWQGEQDWAFTTATYQADLAVISADIGCKLIPCKLLGGSVTGTTVNTAIGNAWSVDPNVLQGPDLGPIYCDEPPHITTNGAALGAALLWAQSLNQLFYKMQTPVTSVTSAASKSGQRHRGR